MEFYLKTGGTILFLLAGFLVGQRAAQEYLQHMRNIESMILCLDRMQGEIAWRLTPMEEIFRDLTAQEGPCAAFFSRISHDFSEERQESLAALWQRTACETFTPSRARDIFAQLGQSLGSFDAEQECHAIAYAVERLKTELEQAQEANRTQGVLKRRLGVAAGIGLAILFL